MGSMGDLVGALVFRRTWVGRVAWEVAWISCCAGDLMGPLWRALLAEIGAGKFGDANDPPWPQKIVYHC